MRIKLPVLLGALCALTFFLSACDKAPTPAATASKDAPAAKPATAAPQIVIKFAVGGPDTLPLFRAVKEHFKPQIEAKSNGRITVELYAGSQLGDDVKLIESLRSGSLEAAGPTSAPLVGIVPEVAILDIPFLFRSTKVADYILDGKIGNEINAKLEANGLYNLAWSEMGFRYLTNNVREIKAPQDIKGLKLRTMENPIHLATWRQLGANPTPMPVSEVFTALKQAAIDGQENPIVAISGWKFYEVNKYITLTGHVYSTLSFLYSKKIFDSYSKEDQDLIRELARETGIKGREIARSDEANYIEAIKKTGLASFTQLTNEQKKAFQDATASVWEVVSAKAGAPLIAELKAELQKAPE